MAENENVEGKVPVYHRTTGEVVYYWPRDAAEVTGHPGSVWTYTTPTDKPSAKPAKRKKAARKGSAKKAPPKKKAKAKKRR